jgi:hypothetical protein
MGDNVKAIHAFDGIFYIITTFLKDDILGILYKWPRLRLRSRLRSRLSPKLRPKPKPRTNKGPST